MAGKEALAFAPALDRPCLHVAPSSQLLYHFCSLICKCDFTDMQNQPTKSLVERDFDSRGWLCAKKEQRFFISGTITAAITSASLKVAKYTLFQNKILTYQFS